MTVRFGLLLVIAAVAILSQPASSEPVRKTVAIAVNPRYDLREFPLETLYGLITALRRSNLVEPDASLSCMAKSLQYPKTMSDSNILEAADACSRGQDGFGNSRRKIDYVARLVARQTKRGQTVDVWINVVVFDVAARRAIDELTAKRIFLIEGGDRRQIELEAEKLGARVAERIERERTPPVP